MDEKLGLKITIASRNDWLGKIGFRPEGAGFVFPDIPDGLGPVLYYLSVANGNIAKLSENVRPHEEQVTLVFATAAILRNIGTRYARWLGSEIEKSTGVTTCRECFRKSHPEECGKLFDLLDRINTEVLHATDSFDLEKAQESVIKFNEEILSFIRFV